MVASFSAPSPLIHTRFVTQTVSPAPLCMPRKRSILSPSDAISTASLDQSVKGSMFIHFGFSSRFSHVPILFAVSLGIYWVFVFVSDVELGVCRSIFAQPRLFGFNIGRNTRPSKPAGEPFFAALMAMTSKKSLNGCNDVPFSNSTSFSPTRNDVTAKDHAERAAYASPQRKRAFDHSGAIVVAWMASSKAPNTSSPSFNLAFDRLHKVTTAINSSSDNSLFFVVLL